MEDAIDVRNNGKGGYMYAAVFDGHGGSPAAEWLKEQLYDIVAKAMSGEESLTSESWTDKLKRKLTKSIVPQAPIYLAPALDRAFRTADERLLEHLSTLEPPDAWCGATATVVLVREDRYVVANVGDSRAVLFRGEKQRPISLSQEHRPETHTQLGKAEIKRIQKGGGWVQWDRVCGVLAVSRALGDHDFKGGRHAMLEAMQEQLNRQAMKATLEEPPVIPVPDVSEVPAEPEKDEFLILATDGLWDVCSNVTVGQFVRRERLKGKSFAEVAQELVREASDKRRSQDNVACIIIDLANGETRR